MAEVKRSLKSLMKGKASGCDNIPPEAWKEEGMVSAKVLHSLLNKKGDLCLCKSWRGIMLLTDASKVLRKIILERTRDALEGRLQDEQAGFRKKRSC